MIVSEYLRRSYHTFTSNKCLLSMTIDSWSPVSKCLRHHHVISHLSPLFTSVLLDGPQSHKAKVRDIACNAAYLLCWVITWHSWPLQSGHKCSTPEDVRPLMYIATAICWTVIASVKPWLVSTLRGQLPPSITFPYQRVCQALPDPTPANVDHPGWLPACVVCSGSSGKPHQSEHALGPVVSAWHETTSSAG